MIDKIDKLHQWHTDKVHNWHKCMATNKLLTLCNLATLCGTKSLPRNPWPLHGLPARWCWAWRTRGQLPRPPSQVLTSAGRQHPRSDATPMSTSTSNWEHRHHNTDLLVPISIKKRLLAESVLARGLTTSDGCESSSNTNCSIRSWVSTCNQATKRKWLRFWFSRNWHEVKMSWDSIVSSNVTDQLTQLTWSKNKLEWVVIQWCASSWTDAWRPLTFLPHLVFPSSMRLGQKHQHHKPNW